MNDAISIRRTPHPFYAALQHHELGRQLAVDEMVRQASGLCLPTCIDPVSKGVAISDTSY